MPSVAEANWGGRSNCGWKVEPILEHCYALTNWEPNEHKDIRDVWSYLTAEDVDFGERPEAFEEFTTIETWAGWAIPGTRVEEPEVNPEKWVEAGEVYGEHVSAERAQQCHPFWAAEFGKNKEREELGGEEYISETLCPSVAHQLVKFVKSPTSGEVCGYYDEELEACTPAADLPTGPFTELQSGNEESLFNYPTGIKGFTESFAVGGVDDRWDGLAKAQGEFFTDATCETNDGIGDVSFTGGGACPIAEKGTAFKQDEEGDGKAKEGVAPADEGNEGPSDTEPGPTSDVEAWAGYEAAAGTDLTDESVEAKGRELAAAQGGTVESIKVVPSKKFETAQPAPAEVAISTAGMSPGYKAYRKTKVDVAEMVGHFSDAGDVVRDIESGIDAAFTHENLVYDAVTGALMRRVWTDQETPREITAREVQEERCAKDRNKCKTFREDCIYYHECLTGESCPIWHEQCDREEECLYYHAHCEKREECDFYHEGCTEYEACAQFNEDCPETESEYDSLKGSPATAFHPKSHPGPTAPEDEEPATIEPVVVSGRLPVRHATVIVTQGRSTVMRTRQRQFKLKAGTYRITARAAGYSCGSRRIRAAGKHLAVRLECSRATS